jgi:hypothetical protein
VERYYSISDVRVSAQGRWRDVLGRFGVRGGLLEGRHGPCPGCGGKDRFRFDDLGGAGTFVCSQGSGDLLSGDGLKLLGHVKGWDWKRCVKEVGDMLNVAVRSGRPSKVDVGVAPEPRSDPAPRPEIDEAAVAECTRGVPAVDKWWLSRRSPVDVAGMNAGEFLSAVFAPGERVLVFTSQLSQGDFLWWCGRGGWRLSQERGVRATASALPEGGPDGVWYLVQPVTGQWVVNATTKWDAESRTRSVQGKWTRRSQPNVTAWRHFVLESDVLPEAVWLRVLAALALPIVAIYSSGKRSMHALVRFPVACKAEWDAARNMLRQIVCPLGADPGALSAVRLSRLPGCRRGHRMQELIYLDPSAAGRAIELMPEVRG